MPEITITKLSDDELALLVAHGALEADRLEAQAEQLRRIAAKARTPRQQRDFLFALRGQDEPSPFDLLDSYDAPTVSTPRQQRDLLFHVADQDTPSPFRLVPAKQAEADEQHDEPGEGNPAQWR